MVKKIAADDDSKKRLVLELRPDLFRRVDDYRYAQHIPTRAEAIRKLIEDALSQSHDECAKSRP